MRLVVCAFIWNKNQIILISSWYFSPVFTGEILLSKNDNSCFSKWICCARGHYLQLPALLNSSLHFILICKFITAKVLGRDSALEIDSSSQGPGALFSSILPQTVFVILEVNKRCSVLENELDKVMEKMYQCYWMIAWEKQLKRKKNLGARTLSWGIFGEL